MSDHSYLEHCVQALMAQGFPRTYAERLAPLAIAHPNWTFEALPIPESWEQVLYYEVDENPARNLITSLPAYTPYRHETNQALYDTGYYQASCATVSYFMDPRNFFNEKDIFQFYCFAAGNQPHADQALSMLLGGTFMEATPKGSEKSYAEIFCEVGAALSVDPIYLAVRARQEQGIHGGMTVGGNADELLTAWLHEGEGGDQDTPQALAAYSGYYNVFNISASGTGRFAVLKAAMERAIVGTPEMSDAWGGSPSWDTVEKSIYGGALTVKTRYIDNDQNTVYLQKFNVSPESSRRFWGQYMQNVAAALSEGRSLYASFAAAQALDGALTFRIPVYADIDEHCPDPAQGACPYTAPSTEKYTISASLSVNGQPLMLPNELPRRIAAGELPVLALAADPSGFLRLSGQLHADGRLSALSLIPCARNGEAYSGEEIRIYSKPTGCDTLHMNCSFLLPTEPVSGDTLTYALTLTMSEGNVHCHRIVIALLELHVP